MQAKMNHDIISAPCLRAQTPNHSRLHESMLSIRHIVEAGAAHMLVGHWGDILHALQRITSP